MLKPYGCCFLIAFWLKAVVFRFVVVVFVSVFVFVRLRLRLRRRRRRRWCRRRRCRFCRRFRFRLRLRLLCRFHKMTPQVGGCAKRSQDRGEDFEGDL